MAYQRKKRSQEQNQQLTVPQVQTSLFASPDLEDVEAENSPSPDISNAALSLEVRRQQASQPGFDFGNIPLFAPERAVQRQPRSPLVQAKLTVGPAGDKYEQEADRVAAQVVDTINNPSANLPVSRQPEIDHEAGPHIAGPQMKELKSIQRATGEEDVQMKPTLQRVGQEGGTVSKGIEAEIQSAKGNGQSLDPDLQQKMGRAMGADFSGVKVHADSKSNQLNTTLQAKAFTTGQDVFFKQGEYQPRSQAGQTLIAHELTHVEQQKGQGSNLNRHGVVQRKIPSQVDTKSQYDNDQYHVSNDYNMIVGADTDNNHDLYATDAKISASQAALKNQKARFQIVKGQPRTFTFEAPINDDVTRYKVIPENIDKQSKSKGTGKSKWDSNEQEYWFKGGMLTPHACDKTAKMVLGGNLSLLSNLGPNNKKEKADIQGGGRLNLQLGAFSLMIRAIENIYVNSDDLGLKLKEKKFLRRYVKLYGNNQFSKKIHAGNVEDKLAAFFSALKSYKRVVKKIAETLQTHSFAMPKVGQGLVMLSAGEEYENEKTWPYHYAGVIMTSGADYVTLENFAVSGKGKAYNTNWNFDMYGTTFKHSFQKQHKDTEQHAKMPVTFVVGGSGYKNWPKGYKPNTDHGTK